jgi:hypothetical protein
MSFPNTKHLHHVGQPILAAAGFQPALGPGYVEEGFDSAFLCGGRNSLPGSFEK